MDWHNYPQHAYAHEDFPWWLWMEGKDSWMRTDGEVMSRVKDKRVGDWYESGWRVWTGRQDLTVEKTSDMDVDAGVVMALYDAENPLPAPRPMMGQGWRWPSGFVAAVQAVDPTGMCDPTGKGRPGVIWPCTVPVMGAEFGRYVTCWTPLDNWPPRLVAEDVEVVSGPGAPWAETSEAGQ